MKCDICGTQTKTRRVRKYHYQECGLPNVFLMNIDVIECPKCAIRCPVISSALELYEKLARAVALKQSPLTGAETKFLRKQLGFASKRWAEYLSVKPETISRWEKGSQAIGPQTDSLIRLFYFQITTEKAGRVIPEHISEAVASVNKRAVKHKDLTLSVDMSSLLRKPAYC